MAEKACMEEESSGLGSLRKQERERKEVCHAADSDVHHRHRHASDCRGCVLRGPLQEEGLIPTAIIGWPSSSDAWEQDNH